jgi:hypothetical protein
MCVRAAEGEGGREGGRRRRRRRRRRREEEEEGPAEQVTGDCTAVHVVVYRV